METYLELQNRLGHWIDPKVIAEELLEAMAEVCEEEGCPEDVTFENTKKKIYYAFMSEAVGQFLEQLKR